MNNVVWDNLKNTIGWKTNRKLIAFAVDDYGNVRLHSKDARKRLDEAGLKIYSRFDAFDTLETREDLEMLFDALNIARDVNGNPAVFTPYALACNINFEKILESNTDRYEYESLDNTLAKLSSNNPDNYAGVFDLINEGIDAKIFLPEFHGREHLNIKAFENKLRNRDPELLVNIQNRSYTSIRESGYPGIGVTAAFSFNDPSETEKHIPIIESGIEIFNKVYGYSPHCFTPPAQQYNNKLDSVLVRCGIKAIDKPLYTKRHLGFGKYKTEINFMKYVKNENYVNIVRNCVFEPTEDRGIDWVTLTLRQIEAAFTWNRPAIISSHRVNFCGLIDQKNRNTGISALKDLLKKISKKWPDAEFISVRGISKLIHDDLH